MPETVLPALTLAQSFVLVSWWKVLLLLVPFVLWARVVSSVYDKHAARFHLSRERWSLLHLVMGAVALVLALAMPIPQAWGFFIGWLAMIVVLAIDLAIYPMIANKDDRVPEGGRLTLDMSQYKEAKAAKAASKQAGTSDLIVTGADKTRVQVPDKESPNFELRVASEHVVIEAINARAAQFDMTPLGEAADAGYGVSMLVDGVRQGATKLPAARAMKVMNFWKQAGGMDVEDRRRKLMGQVNVEYRGAHYKLSLTSSGGKGGMRFTGVFNADQAVRKPIEELGLLDAQLEELRTITGDQRGVVLLAAPPDQGGTTTLYSILRMHDAYTNNVQTIEVDIQDAMEGVRQNAFDPYAEGQEYSKLLRSTLRRDPDVVGVAELPDADTAKEASAGDHDHTRTYLSVRADSALAAIQIYAKAVGDLNAAADSLRGAVAQKLLRRLCVNCRVGYQPTPDMLKKLGLPEGKVSQLFKKGGQVLIKGKPDTCPMCNGAGYLGQIGVFEVYRLGDEELRLIKDKNFAGLKAALRKRQLPSMQQAALRHAVEGSTSIEEIIRVVSDSKGKSG